MNAKTAHAFEALFMVDVFDRRTIVYVIHCVCVFICFYVMCNFLPCFVHACTLSEMTK